PLPAERPARLHARHGHVARGLSLRADEEGREVITVRRHFVPVAVALSFLLLTGPAFDQKAVTDPLPSWNDGPAKKAIRGFVRVTTDKVSNQYVPPAQRLATFDQDGTLWV